MSEWLVEGDTAPDFELRDDKNKIFKLSDCLGKPVVIFFYPKDDTPGCTKEACSFRDAASELSKSNAVVVGISGDSVQSHEKFRDKYTLNFPLLADVDNRVSTQYGAYREKNMYGKKSMGIQRSTYILDATGKIIKLFKRVSVDGHDQQVLDVLSTLASK